MNTKFHCKFFSIVLTSMIGVGYFLLGTNVIADEIKNLEKRLEYLIKKKELDQELNKIKVKLNKLQNEYSDVIKTSTIKPKVDESEKISSASIKTLVDAIGPYKQDLSRLSSKNGKIISNKKLDLSRNSEIVDYYRIKYLSDELKIEGFVIIPKNKTGKIPAIIYNRGGNRSYGELTKRHLMWLSMFSRQGYVILASQYREGGDSEGSDEFGGADVNDVLNLLALTKSLPIVDGNRIGMLGFSRGGMMTYLAIKKGADVKAAVVLGGVTDLVQWVEDRGSRIYDIVSELTGGDDEAKWRERSVTSWPHKIKIPLLIMHGEDDQAVDVSQAEKLADKLEVLYKELDAEFRFVKFEGGDHALMRPHARRKNTMIQRWFDKHLGN